MISSRTAVEINPVAVRADNDPVEHVVESCAAARIHIRLGKQRPDACATALRHPFHDPRIGAVSYGEISHQVNGPVWPDGHALRAIANAVISSAIKPRASRSAVSGLERHAINVAIEFGIVQVVVPRIFGNADGG